MFKFKNIKFRYIIPRLGDLSIQINWKLLNNYTIKLKEVSRFYASNPKPECLNMHNNR